MSLVFLLFFSSSFCTLTRESHDYTNRAKMFSRRPVILSYPKTLVGRVLVLHHPGHAAGGCAGWCPPAHAEQGSVLSSM